MKILLTGLSAELFSATELEITESMHKVSELKQFLISRKPGLKDQHTAVSVNSVLSGESADITEKDKILIFHPFAGG